MNKDSYCDRRRPWLGCCLAAVSLALLCSPPAVAADRVVLAEEFSNTG